MNLLNEAVMISVTKSYFLEFFDAVLHSAELVLEVSQRVGYFVSLGQLHTLV